MFGFGDKTGIDLPGEADTSSLIYTAENMGPTDLATNLLDRTTTVPWSRWQPRFALLSMAVPTMSPMW